MRSGALTALLAVALACALALPSIGVAAGSPAGRAGSGGAGAGDTAPGGGAAPAQPGAGGQPEQAPRAGTRGGGGQPVDGSSEAGESIGMATVLLFLLVLFVVAIAVPVQIAKGVASRRQASAETTALAAVSPHDPGNPG